MNKALNYNKAKGLEFEHVIIPITNHPFLHPAHSQVLLLNENGQLKAGFNLKIQSETYKNDYFDRISPTEKTEIAAEETRLLYVAMTRAQKSITAKIQDQSAPSHRINSWNDLLTRGEQYV